MKFIPLGLTGAYLIQSEPFRDERGSFSRVFCRNEFEANGLNPNLVQCNVSYNSQKGTLRGMHYQKSPHSEVKLVRCVKGKIYDVIIDLREDSKTYKRWEAHILTPETFQLLYIPEGFAHGYQTLENDTEIFYQVSHPFVREADTGVRWDDFCFDINWPLKVSAISQKDQNFVNYI